MQWSTREPFYSPCLHSVTYWINFSSYLLWSDKKQPEWEGLLLAYSWGTGVHCGWGVCGGGLATVVLQSGSGAQTSSEASLRAFLQWLTSSRDVHFLRRPHTFKIAALIEDQVFKHKACRRTFHIKPQQWLRALASFLNNPWIFAFSRLTQLVQILLTYWLVTVCSRPLFVSVCAPYLVFRRAAREESPRASQGSVISRYKLVMAQAVYPLVLTYVPMPFLVPGTPCTAPMAQARCCFHWHPDNFIFQIHTPLWLTIVNIVAFWNSCLPSTWDFVSLTSFLLNFPVPNPG